jgi:hypothetical protein
MDYPIKESIRSVFPYFDEIVVCDTSDGTDNTLEVLEELKKEFGEKEFKIIRGNANWSAQNGGIYDGKMKAMARLRCTGDYLWPQDIDEILMPTSREQIESLCKKLDENIPVMALPIVEPWNNSNRIRCDVNPWKWRLSKNLPHITHGIPLSLRRYEGGLLYAKHGCDGCEIVDSNTGQMISFVNFMKPETEQLRQRATTDISYAKEYEQWLNGVINKLPTIYHLSWWSIYEKMKKFQKFWSKSWDSLYGDTHPDGYPFFSKPWNQVTDQEMREEAKRLEASNGHIFHAAYDGKTIKNAVTINRPVPEVARAWCDKHKE